MEHRTILSDPTSSSADRTIWRIPAGIRFLAGKVRVGNFRVQNNSSLPVYFGTQGIYSLILRVSILNLQGTEIDRLAGDALQLMALRLMQAENADQYSINRVLAQSMCNSVVLPSMSQKALTEQSGRDSATSLSAYIDISSMLKYLSVARNIIDEGMIVQLEWNAPSMVQNGFSFDRYPTLFYDEIISNLQADKGDVYTYPTIVTERCSIPSPGSGAQTASYQKRLNSLYAQYVQTLFFYLLNDPQSTAPNPLNLAIAGKKESMSISIDGRQLIPFSSINTASKKLAFLTDFFGSITCTGLEAVYPGFRAYANFDGDANNYWGLKNVNTNTLYNGILSYGAIKIAQFITNDITIDYRVEVDLAAGQYATLVLMAEVVRTYTKSSGMVANLQLPPTVNTM